MLNTCVLVRPSIYVQFDSQSFKVEIIASFFIVKVIEHLNIYVRRSKKC